MYCFNEKDLTTYKGYIYIYEYDNMPDTAYYQIIKDDCQKFYTKEDVFRYIDKVLLRENKLKRLKEN